jgi:hypothetical protein
MQQCNTLNVRRQRREERMTRSSFPVDASWLFDTEGQGSDVRALYRLLCIDTNCDICHGNEEARARQNLENIKLLFRR